MKWTEAKKEQLKKLAFAKKSNKEIAAAMNLPVNEIYAARSRYGLTIAKVEAELKKQKSPDVAIKAEIKELEKVRKEAYKKIKECDKKIRELGKKLFNENLVKIARGK